MKKLIINRKKMNTIFLFVGAILVATLSIGYSALSQNLHISGDVFYNAKSKYLYDVLKSAAEEGTYAREYTGEHQDSMAGVGTKKIYHWYGSNDTNGTAILDKNNVIFAGHCWQMIRTTDTGGVKMIYNGEAENNQCLNTRGNHVGYANRTTQTLNTTYYYGTSYTYDKTNNVFSLDGTITTGSINLGEYTCKQTTANGTCATLYLVDNLSSGSTYNVIPLNGNSNYSQFGTLQFNQQYNSLADVGYMYNTRYTYNSKTMTNTETMLSSYSLATTYWYANSVTWGSPTANRYNLNSPYQVSSTSDYPNLVGKYTFINATQTYTSSSVYYIAAVNGTSMYYIQLNNSGNHTLAYFNYTYTYGDSYTDNGNGTYTINNATTINRSDWYTSYSNVGANKYVCKNATNNTCSELWYTTATSNTSMTYIKDFTNVKYAKGFTYNNGTYTLNSDSVSLWNISDSTNQASINNAHYTCWNTTGECTTISYIYYISGTTPYYINITGGKGVEDAKNEMLYDTGVNSINSTMKTGVDAWYKKYLLEDYDDKLEDTIFCNDRSIRELNGWDPDGGSVTYYLNFKEYPAGSDLSCTNITDKFSVSNSSAQLTYKVGLMSSPEANILNNSNARKTGQNYWLASPCNFGNYYAFGRRVGTNGYMDYAYVYFTNGVRPAVSLTPGTRYSDGDGSMANPYVVEVSQIPDPVSFSTDSWATIIRAVQTNNTSAYNVGDTKTIDMGTFGTHTLRIANKSTPAECSTTGFSQTACGFVLEFADIITYHRMNPYTDGSTNGDGNKGGWEHSEMRTYVNTDIYNALPTKLKNGIVNTTVVSGHGSNDSNNFTTTDKLYLLDAKEIYGTSFTVSNNTAKDSERQLDYYSNLGVTTSSYSGAKKPPSGSSYSWWLRSAISYSAGFFYFVRSTGNYYDGISNDECGVSPAFRIS